MFSGNELGQLLFVGLQYIAVTKENTRALRGRGGRPTGESRFGGLDRFSDLARAGIRRLSRDLTGSWVEDVAKTITLAIDSPAVDEMLENGGHGSTVLFFWSLVTISQFIFLEHGARRTGTRLARYVNVDNILPNRGRRATG